MTYTYVEMELSRAAYDEIAGKMREAEYHQAFHDAGRIDMHGIAVVPHASDEAHRRSAASMEEMAREWLEESPHICRQCGCPLPNPDCGHRLNGVYPCCQPQVEDNVASLASLLAQVRAQAISEERKRRGENT